MDYSKPAVADLGTLLNLTQGGVLGLQEDGTGKTTYVDTPVGDVSVVFVP